MRKTSMFMAVIIFTMTLFTSFFPVEVSAAEAQKAENAVYMQQLRTQTEDDYIVGSYPVNTSKGPLTVVAGCTYTVQWDEGYTGWVTSVAFTAPYASLNYNECSIEPYGITQITGSYAYQKYKAGGIIVVLRLFCDEWGNVSMTCYVEE